MRFDGKVAIVTGAAHGIGLGIGRRLAREGARLVLADVDGVRLKQAMDQFGDDETAIAVEGDLSQRPAADSLVAEAIATFGQVDILVNNAGGGVIRPTLAHDDETLQTTVNRNLWTTVHTTLAVLAHMSDRRYGRIVNLGAESVRNGLDCHAIYNAAKGGVHGLTTGLAREFALRGITVNTVAPALTMTDQVENMLRLVELAGQGEDLVEVALREDPALGAFARELGPVLSQASAMYDRMLATIPMGRAATVDEVASLVAYLASDEAGFITGQVISLNGGSSMQ